MAAVWEYVPYILGGLRYTLGIAAGGIALALMIGVLAGCLRLSRSRSVRFATIAFIEFFRGTSEVVQLYWVFFALPLLMSISITPVIAAILVLGLNQGAYVAEIVRGALQAIPKSQREAAVALNFSPLTTLRKVVLPQAFATMLPSLANISVDLVKATSIVSLITVADITFRAQQVRNNIGHSFLIYGLLLVMYLLITGVVTLVFRVLENRLPLGMRAEHGRV